MPTPPPPEPLAIIYCNISSLKPYVQNARTHTRAQIKLVARSMETYGFTNPILIDDDDSVIAGHARLAAAKLLGMTKVPTIRLSHMTPSQKARVHHCRQQDERNCRRMGQEYSCP